MFGWIKKWQKRRAQRLAFEVLCHKHGFSLGGDGPRTIAGQVADEFGYLLRYYSGGKVDGFDDFPRLVKATPAINSAIAQDLLNTKTREEETLGVSRATATGNLNRLKKILQAVDAYVRYAKEHGAPMTPP